MRRDEAAILSSPVSSKGSGKRKAPEQTHQEAKYLRYLIDNKIRVRVRLENDEVHAGMIEFYDESFIRLTRLGEPNLFIYKHDIKYLYED